jgi:hypothetical protein
MLTCLVDLYHMALEVIAKKKTRHGTLISALSASEAGCPLTALKSCCSIEGKIAHL